MVVEGWTLGVAQGTDGPEPRIRDVDLGERLKLKDPRKIRQLIKSLVSAGIINPFAFMHAAGINGRGRPATEFWLTEDEALFVAMRSDAEGAILLQREMIRVFMLARRGLLPQQSVELHQIFSQLAETNRSVLALAASMTNLSQALAANTQRIEALEARASGSGGPQGRISSLECLRLLEAFRVIATLTVGPQVAKDHEQNRRWRKARLVADHKTRLAIRYPMGRKWCALDPRDLNEAWARIDELREEARRIAAQRKTQGTLLS